MARCLRADVDMCRRPRWSRSSWARTSGARGWTAHWNGRARGGAIRHGLLLEAGPLSVSTGLPGGSSGARPDDLLEYRILAVQHLFPHGQMGEWADFKLRFYDHFLELRRK